LVGASLVADNYWKAALTSGLLSNNWVPPIEQHIHFAIGAFTPRIENGAGLSFAGG
jgi:hypothetical protein